MSIPTGKYIITNVFSSNSLALLDPNDGTSLVGSAEQKGDVLHWNVIQLNNGKYTIASFKYASYANAGTRAVVGDYVVGRSSSQQFVIRETRKRDEFTIAPADRPLYFWGLEDGEENTPVTLSPTDTDRHNQWHFSRV